MDIPDPDREGLGASDPHRCILDSLKTMEDGTAQGEREI